MTYEYTTSSSNLVSYVFSDDEPIFEYRYENSKYPTALTEIRDGGGILLESYTYNSAGLVVSSELAGGAERVEVDYSIVGGYVDSATIRNALGRTSTYKFDAVGVNNSSVIVKVSGHESANCAAANMAYSYDANGFIASETDWEGNVTAYSRDSLGRELSRTEAYGTPEARTITTEWHVTLNVPVKVTSPEQIIENTYDAGGRLLDRKVTPVSL
ncbi:hypothetical protein Mag101_06640 [Microbulbifer agarilyticus]|uniref:Sugar-binding protein n=1 Tax=Microbulbifer agarilyticus TaxID=260552 RepID=A0A1Q2MA63_9GAMM|nr:hypothetical protein Mag101_06640 [Microbulbifer agarilyticus]